MVSLWACRDMPKYSETQTELLNQQRKLLYVYSGLSTEAEFGLKLNSIIDKLKENKHFEKFQPDTLKKIIMEENFYIDNDGPILLKDERIFQNALADLASRLKISSESFLIAFRDYKTTFGLDKMGLVLSRKFLDIDERRQSCLLNIAINTAYKNEEHYSDELINLLLKSGVEIDVDFGYHGQRHSLREVPPLINAIQKSNNSDNKDKQKFYTDIAEKLIEKGASINKLRG